MPEYPKYVPKTKEEWAAILGKYGHAGVDTSKDATVTAIREEIAQMAEDIGSRSDPLCTRYLERFAAKIRSLP